MCRCNIYLHSFTTYFYLQGEAQKIERIVERFAQRYCLCNPTFISQFKSVDTVFLIAFAIIMLNTDLHNPNIKQARKMKLEAFIKNLKGTNNKLTPSFIVEQMMSNGACCSAGQVAVIGLCPSIQSGQR